MYRLVSNECGCFIWQQKQFQVMVMFPPLKQHAFAPYWTHSHLTFIRPTNQNSAATCHHSKWKLLKPSCSLVAPLIESCDKCTTTIMLLVHLQVQCRYVAPCISWNMLRLLHQYINGMAPGLDSVTSHYYEQHSVMFLLCTSFWLLCLRPVFMLGYMLQVTFVCDLWFRFLHIQIGLKQDCIL